LILTTRRDPLGWWSVVEKNDVIKYVEKMKLGVANPLILEIEG